jgi:two-component system, LuxR family, sensor kinase FixL
MSARASLSLKAYAAVRPFAQYVTLKTQGHGVEALKKPAEMPVDIGDGPRISMLEELGASIAHEVRQPLAAIQINGELALRLLGGPDPKVARARDAMQRIVADVRRADEIISRMRDMAAGHPP